MLLPKDTVVLQKALRNTSGVYVYVCVFLCSFVHVYRFGYEGYWPTLNFFYYSQPCFLRVSHWIQSSLIQLCWLARKPWRSSCLPSTGITGMHHYTPVGSVGSNSETELSLQPQVGSSSHKLWKKMGTARCHETKKNHLTVSADNCLPNFSEWQRKNETVLIKYSAFFAIAACVHCEPWFPTSGLGPDLQAGP